MSKIIDFNERTTEQEQPKDQVKITMPTVDEINLVNAIVNSYPEDEMVDIKFWNGNCWKSIFEQVIKPYAEEQGFDVWDVMAVFIMKMNGTTFTKNENGSITISTR